MTCANGHPLPVGWTHCATCGAPAARLCANGHALAPGFQLCSTCGAFAAAPASAAAGGRPSGKGSVDNTWVYFGCAVAIVLAVVVVVALVVRSSPPNLDAAARAKPAPVTASTRPPSTTSTSTSTTRPTRGGAFEITPERLKAELESQGMPPKQASCIVDGLVEEGIDLSTFAAPTEEQQRLLVEIASRCAAGG